MQQGICTIRVFFSINLRVQFLDEKLRQCQNVLFFQKKYFHLLTEMVLSFLILLQDFGVPATTLHYVHFSCCLH